MKVTTPSMTLIDDTKKLVEDAVQLFEKAIANEPKGEYSYYLYLEGNLPYQVRNDIELLYRSAGWQTVDCVNEGSNKVCLKLYGAGRK